MSKTKRVSFSEKPPLIRAISNPYNKDDNKRYTQSDNEYERNKRMKLLGFLSNTGTGPGFDPEILANEIRNDCAKGDENFCRRAMKFLSGIVTYDTDDDTEDGNGHRKLGGGIKRKAQTKKYKHIKTNKQKFNINKSKRIFI